MNRKRKKTAAADTHSGDSSIQLQNKNFEERKKIDKSWIDLLTRVSREYFNGIDKFLEFAYENRAESSFISCPCRKCVNRYNYSQEVVRDHLYCDGFLKKYKNWTSHGEPYVSLHDNKETKTAVDSYMGDDRVDMINETLRNLHESTSVDNDEETANDSHTGPNEETANDFKLLKNAPSKLHLGCVKSTISVA